MEIQAAEGCSDDRFVLVAGIVSTFPVVEDDFDADRGWTVDPDGTDDALAGVWVRDEPNGTLAQPDVDHTPGPGGLAWVTGNDACGGDDADDVTVKPLRGAAGAIAKNMQASLELPTATSVRAVPAPAGSARKVHSHAPFAVVEAAAIRLSVAVTESRSSLSVPVTIQSPLMTFQVGLVV